jgi:Protein of unknown function (DUF3048) N-terminal domain/Protein of unknown function (DUF3048) C-terminal domain
VIRREGRASRIAPAAAVLLAAALAVLLAACSPSNPTPSASPGTGLVAIASPAEPSSSPSPTPSSSPSTAPSVAPSVAPSPSPTPVPTPSLVVDPLTGELVSPAAAALHPIAVMIDDLGPARPQSGLSSASIVWQAPAEGGIPRYMAIFGAIVPTDVGPVRSSRYYYIAWASEYKAMYVHAGGSPQALSTLKAQGNGQLVYNADEFAYGGSFRRIKTRLAPHNLYTTGRQLRRLATALHATAAPKALWTFDQPAPLTDRPLGGKISFAYPHNSISYAYDRASNTYLRTVSLEGAQHDAATKLRIGPTNVVVMWMKFGPLNDGEAYKHRLEATVVGSGPAWVASNGHTVKGTWKKTSVSGPTLFYDGGGNQIDLTVGQTFVNVLTWGTPVSVHDGKVPPPTLPTRPVRV